MVKKVPKIPHLVALLISCFLFASCSSVKLATTGVIYQSVRTDNYKGEIPQDAKIAVLYSISGDGHITPIVVNKTDNIMIIDQTMSFFVNSDGNSTSYYDPTIKTTSKTDIASGTSGASVNLGAVAGAFGIGGAIGAALGGINVGGSETSGTSTTNTTYFADQPRISLSPRSRGAMSKSFNISNVGFTPRSNAIISNLLAQSTKKLEPIATNNSRQSFFAKTRTESPIQFSICISYSLDNGETFEKIVTDFYVNAQIAEAITQKGRVNEALRKIFQHKPDAINEQWWVLHFSNNLPSANNIYDTEAQGLLYDYQ